MDLLMLINVCYFKKEKGFSLGTSPLYLDLQPLSMEHLSSPMSVALLSVTY